VVRDLTLVVVAHDIGTTAAGRVVGPAAHRGPPFLLRNEAVHSSPVDVCQRIRLGVGAAMVHVALVVKWLHALQAHGIGDAHRRDARAHRDAVGTGERAEVAIERTGLLHDDDYVVDLSLRTSHLMPEIRSAEIAGPRSLGDQQHEQGHQGEGERPVPRTRDPLHRPAVLRARASAGTRAALSWTLEADGGARLRRFPRASDRILWHGPTD